MCFCIPASSATVEMTFYAAGESTSDEEIDYLMKNLKEKL